MLSLCEAVGEELELKLIVSELDWIGYIRRSCKAERRTFLQSW